MATVWAKHALIDTGWHDNVMLDIGADGRILSVSVGAKPCEKQVDILVSAPANTHSHAFQRAMAGLSEARGPHAHDSFWTWRDIMYRFVDVLTPDDVQAIAAFLYMEMLEAGFAAVAEFHYLHHGVGGQAYNNVAEMASRIIGAVNQTGIGLTLLPVLYAQGGCDGRALAGGQMRFGNDIDGYAKLHAQSAKLMTALPDDCVIGASAHSLRAVSSQQLECVTNVAYDAPIHIHIAEQDGEVAEVLAYTGKRPVQWLLDNHAVDARWCLIHATQMTQGETIAVAKSGAVVGLCPITESSLGDGIFPAREYFGAGGAFSIGSDSNIRISLADELRTLAYSQRLQHKERAVLATDQRSVGRVLMDGAARGGAQACGRDSGVIAVGQYADLLALDAHHSDLLGKSGDTILDSFVFCGAQNMVTDVWSAGRHMVRDGQHIHYADIKAAYNNTILSLMERL